jgi:hypothetical protein
MKNFEAKMVCPSAGVASYIDGLDSNLTCWILHPVVAFES